MFLDATESYLIDYGSTDPGCHLWQCETATGRTQFITLTDGPASVQAASGSFFVARRRNHFTVRLFSDPNEIVAEIKPKDDIWQFFGDLEVWDSLPQVYADSDGLLIIDPHRRTVERHEFNLFRNIEMEYPPHHAAFVPGQNLIVIAIARDPDLILYDPISRQKVQQIPLANRGGHPRLFFRKTAPELWVSDYDTLVRFHVGDWQTLNSLLLQETNLRTYISGTSRFLSIFPLRSRLKVIGPMALLGLVQMAGGNVRVNIGDYALNQGESYCAVARPLSGDVLLIDTRAFQVTHRVVTGGYPEGAALLSDGRVFARDPRAREVIIRDRWEPFSL